jgi:hypothetical protein
LLLIVVYYASNIVVFFLSQRTGKEGCPTVTFEAVADQRHYIWHMSFGVPGSCNDINILDRSPLLNDLMYGKAPEIEFVVNNNIHDMGYYLTDGIYPDWKIFVKAIPLPQGFKRQHFTKMQEAERKDVKRAFAGLQVRLIVACCALSVCCCCC